MYKEYKDFEISKGTIRIVDYQSSIEVYFWEKENFNEANTSFVIDADSCHDFTTGENIDYFIANFEYAVTLTDEDKEKIREELYIRINPFSADE